MTEIIDHLNALAERVLQLAEGDEAIVTAGRSDHGLTRFANSFIHQHVSDESTMVGLTLVRDGRVATTATTNVTDDGLRALAMSAAATADLLPADPRWPGVAPEVILDGRMVPANEADPQRRATIVADFVTAGDGMQAAGYCDTSEVTHVVATSTGSRLVGRSTRATLDGIQQAGGGGATAAGSGHRTAQGLDDLDGTSVGALAAGLARRGLDRVDLEPGRYPVVLAPECTATIALFLSVYGFNAKSHAEGQSAIEVGVAQFDAAITLVDDPNAGHGFGLGFDVEGTPQRALPLIDAGVSAALVHDRRTAAAAGPGVQSTGHSGPGSAAWGPVADQLHLAGGTTDPLDLVAAMGRGLVVTTFNYCRILDPKTMVVTGLTRNGTFLVEDGRIVGAVGNLRFTQSFMDALAPAAVTGLGNDARWADAEFGPALAHAPSLALQSWNITGAAPR